MDEQINADNLLVPVCPTEIEGLEPLIELAIDLRWSWVHGTDQIWRTLDPELWNLTHNPWIVLRTVGWSKLKEMLSNPDFRNLVDQLALNKRNENKSPGWFQQKYPQSPLTHVAYFSMEFMLSEALPIYSGGLGNVAGDQLKTASDLGVPVIGIGLLYQQGYFRQIIDKNGNQQALFPYNDPGQLPIVPLRGANGEWLRIEIKLPGYSLFLRTWQVQVGKLKLYLLDSNDMENDPTYRGITSELYGGGLDLRMKQELILGIGGWRLLNTLGIKPEVCHLNEGHAAFAILERAKSFMQETGQPFHVALNATRAGNLFTTHTAVPAAFDRFPPSLIEQYLGAYAQNDLGITLHDLLALGRQNPEDSSEPFNMAYLAIHGSGSVNGVSQLHGKVSQQLFASLFPRWPQEEVPVGYVTNGVHVPSWDSIASDNFWTETCGKNRWLGDTITLESQISNVSDHKIWQMRNDSRQSLVEYARQRLSRQLESTGFPLELVESAKHLFDPHTLTLGFARRFATYKRPNMLLHDPDRLIRLLTNSEHPVQLIIAGKAHPEDQPGQALIHQWIEFIRQPQVRPHAIFISDYDMLLTENLVQGVDVWINTPRRPWEACGTSGMKVLVNGGINLSELDGWWAEAYTPEVGWALGDRKEHGDDPAWDAKEAEQLYDILENQVIPEFYNRNEEGIPVDWIRRMRKSMAKLTAQYSANRTVRQYTEEHYLPAAKNYHERLADQAALGKEILNWRQSIKQNWDKVRFGPVKVETNGNQHTFEVQVYLNGLDPQAVKVELYANQLNGEPSFRQEMTHIRQLSGDVKTSVYRASVPTLFPAADYTPRVIPYHAGVAVPLELNYILWQK